MKLNKPILIGLTGGSGCGKTTVANILKAYDSYIIDADEISHKVIQKGEQAYFEIIQIFSEKILDMQKNIDRKILASIVFSEKEKLKQLEKITHKYILKEIENQIDFAKNNTNHKYIVLDAPLLIETGLYKIVDTVWVVFAEEEERIKRLIKRDNISEENVRKRLQNQTPFEKIKPFANFIIENEKNINLEQIILEQLNKEQK